MPGERVQCIPVIFILTSGDDIRNFPSFSHSCFTNIIRGHVFNFFFQRNIFIRIEHNV